MYYRRLETNPFAMQKHNEAQAYAAAERLKEVARKKKAKKALKKEAAA